MSFAADDFEAIRRREEEIKAERNLILTGSATEPESKKTEGWSMYGTIGYDYDPA